MNLLYHLAVTLLVVITVCSPAVSRADSLDPQTLLVQTTPAAGQDPQTTEVEKTVEGVPELYMPDRSYRFENVPAGQTVTHEFTVQNKGTGLLRITRVKTG
jgi:hypothetical protein